MGGRVCGSNHWGSDRKVDGARKQVQWAGSAAIAGVAKDWQADAGTVDAYLMRTVRCGAAVPARSSQGPGRGHAKR